MDSSVTGSIKAYSSEHDQKNQPQRLTEPFTQPLDKSMLKRIFFQGLGLAIWGAAVYGTSLIHLIKLPGEHTICGPWGCAAEPSALLGYHLFLLVLIAPALVVGCCAVSQPRGRQIARWSFLGGLIGILGFVIWGAGNWIIEGNGAEYAMQRGLFVLVTTPDLPLMQLSLSGVIAMIILRAMRKMAPNHIKMGREQVDPLNRDGGEATIVF